MSALDALAPVKGASPGPAPWRALKPGLSRNRCTQWPQGCWRPSPRGIKSSIVDGHATLARLLGNLHNLHKLKKTIRIKSSPSTGDNWSNACAHDLTLPCRHFSTFRNVLKVVLKVMVFHHFPILWLYAVRVYIITCFAPARTDQCIG